MDGHVESLEKMTNKCIIKSEILERKYHLEYAGIIEKIAGLMKCNLQENVGWIHLAKGRVHGGAFLSGPYGYINGA
jgi:hypothetical protein